MKLRQNSFSGAGDETCEQAGPSRFAAFCAFTVKGSQCMFIPTCNFSATLRTLHASIILPGSTQAEHPDHTPVKLVIS
jgi:hypothetical protein